VRVDAECSACLIRVPGAAQHEARSAACALQTRDPGFLLAFMQKRFFVYILASRYRGTLYVGVTNDLVRRVSEHQSGLIPGFTKTYKIHKLVYYEEYESILEARSRERVLKRWRRDWKFKLIEAVNPRWRNLSSEITVL
jgi:putative endonuclease